MRPGRPRYLLVPRWWPPELGCLHAVWPSLYGLFESSLASCHLRARSARGPEVEGLKVCFFDLRCSEKKSDCVFVSARSLKSGAGVSLYLQRVLVKRGGFCVGISGRFDRPSLRMQCSKSDIAGGVFGGKTYGLRVRVDGLCLITLLAASAPKLLTIRVGSRSRLFWRACLANSQRSVPLYARPRFRRSTASGVMSNCFAE